MDVTHHLIDAPADAETQSRLIVATISGGITYGQSTVSSGGRLPLVDHDELTRKQQTLWEP